MKEFLGSGEFVWFVGVVEDRNDPLKLGRVRVRMFGWHTDNKNDLPTSSLPWSTVIRPSISESVGDIGHSPTGLLPGTWVAGFFTDGKDRQNSLILGSIGGIPQFFATPTKGFNDPSGIYPYRINEPDVSRLARNENIENTIVATKTSTLNSNVSIANSTDTWNQPVVPYAAQYPYNKVRQTESGHTEEYDDTPYHQRIHFYHKSGTFSEIDSSGTKVNKIVGDDFEIIERNGYVHIKGQCNITIEGNCNLHVKNDVNLEVSGSMNSVIRNDLNFDVSGQINMSSKEAINMKAPLIKSEASLQMDISAPNYYETVGKSYYRWEGDKYTFTGKDTYSRSDSGTDYSCPTDTVRVSAESCPTVVSASSTGLSTPADRLNPTQPSLSPLSVDEEFSILFSQREVTTTSSVISGVGAEDTSSLNYNFEVFESKQSYVIGVNNYDFLREKEGLSLKPYRDGSSYSIGYGHWLKYDIERGSLTIGSENLAIDDVFSNGITKEQAETLYAQDIAIREEQLNRSVPLYSSLNDNQKTAILSYYYNTGRLPSNLNENLNNGDFDEVASSIENGINTTQGNVSTALTIRRKEEANLFRS